MKERQYVKNGHVIRKRVHSDLVRTLALNASSGALYSGSLDKTAKIWDVKDMRPTRTMADSGVGSIWAVAVTHDDRYLLTGDNAKNVKKWDVQTGDCISNKNCFPTEKEELPNDAFRGYECFQKK